MLQIKLLYCFFSHKLIKTKILIKKNFSKTKLLKEKFSELEKGKKIWQPSLQDYLVFISPISFTHSHEKSDERFWILIEDQGVTIFDR